MARYRVGLQTRGRILAATRALVSEVGLDGTTLKAILERARVRPGSFYNLFQSKEEAILTVVGEAITAVDPDPDHAGTETVEDLVDAYVEFLTGEPELARVYIQLAVTGGLTDETIRSRILGHQRRRVERLAEALSREPGLDHEEAAFQAQALLATLNGLAYVWLLEPGLDLRRHADRLLADRAALR